MRWPAIKSREDRIYLFSAIVTLGFVFSIIFHYRSLYVGLGYPHITFLFRPDDYFNDFYNTFRAIVSGNPYRYSITMPYFPLIFLFLYPLRYLHPGLVLGIMLSLGFLLIGIINYTKILMPISNPYLKFLLMVPLLLMPYPFLFSFDRANVEIILFVIIGLFVFAFKKDRRSSSLWLAIAINIKLYPATLLLLYLVKKDYRKFGVTVLLTTLIGVASYALLAELTASSLLQIVSDHAMQLKKFHMQYSSTMDGIIMGHSLWSVASYYLFSTVQSHLMSQWMFFYALTVFALFFLIAVFVLRIQLSFWKQLALLMIPMIFFPYTSSDYTLIHLYFVVAVFLSEEKIEKGDFLDLFLLSLLFIPMDYIRLTGEITSSVIIYPAVAMIFVVKNLLQGFLKSRL